MKVLCIITLLVVLVLGVSVTTATAATAQTACSDAGFLSKKGVSTRQLSTALDYFELESYRSAEAWALRSWRTLYVTSPCRSTYRRWRKYQLNSAAAIWNAVKAERRGDHQGAYELVSQAGRWTDRAGAEEATWG